MNKLLCLIICFFVGTLIYLLMRNYCGCQMIERQEEYVDWQENGYDNEPYINKSYPKCNNIKDNWVHTTRWCLIV